MDVRICSYTEEDKLLAEKIIKHVRREAARKYTYLEKAIFYLTPEICEEIKCIGANYSKLFYNPNGVIELYVKNYNKLEKAILHIVLHCLLLHPSFDMKDDALFDAAADIWVDAMLENCDDRSFNCEIKNFLTNNKCSSVSQLYNTAVSDQKIAKRLRALAEKSKNDDHSTWYMKSKQNNPETEISEGNPNGLGALIADWKSMLGAAESQCNMMYGTGSGNIFSPIEPLDRFSKFSYKEYIRRFAMEEIVEDDPETIDIMLYTTSMEMYDDIPIVEWNEIRERCNPSDIIIAIDMSGSCGGETASNFLRQIYTLFDEMNIRGNVNIHTVFFDTQILETSIIRNKNDADEFIRNYTPHGFGGTSFNCVFDYADNFSKISSGRKLKGLFFFSDACGEFPREKKPYPTTFFVPECEWLNLDFVPNWVELVHYNDEQIG